MLGKSYFEHLRNIIGTLGMRIQRKKSCRNRENRCRVNFVGNKVDVCRSHFFYMAPLSVVLMITSYVAWKWKDLTLADVTEYVAMACEGFYGSKLFANNLLISIVVLFRSFIYSILSQILYNQYKRSVDKMFKQR